MLASTIHYPASGCTPRIASVRLPDDYKRRPGVRPTYFDSNSYTNLYGITSNHPMRRGRVVPVPR